MHGLNGWNVQFGFVEVSTPNGCKVRTADPGAKRSECLLPALHYRNVLVAAINPLLCSAIVTNGPHQTFTS